MWTTGEDTLTKKILKGVHLVFFFKQTSVAYKKGDSELLSCHVAAEIIVYCIQKTRCVIWKSEKISRSSNLNRTQYLLPKFCIFFLPRIYLQYCEKDFKVKSYFLINFLICCFTCKNFSKATSTVKRKSDRISTDGLNERDLFLFFNKNSSFASSSKNKNFAEVKVKTFEFAKSIKQCCIKRSDQWEFTVLGRVECKISDLYAADCMYHGSSWVNFRTGKQVKVHSSVELC